MKRAAIWFAMNGTFGVLIYFGLFAGVAGAGNAAYFMAWFLFAISLLTTSDEAKVMIASKPREVPLLLSVAFDAACILAFAWVGAYVTATALVMHAILIEGARMQGKELLAKAAK